MIEATFTELLVLGYVAEEITDNRTNQTNTWHRLDVRDERSGKQMYFSLTDPAGKKLTDAERDGAKALLGQVQELAMGERIKVTAEVNPEITARGGQLVKFKLRSLAIAGQKLTDKAAA